MIKTFSLTLSLLLATVSTNAFPLVQSRNSFVKRGGLHADDVPIVTIRDPIAQSQNILEVYHDQAKTTYISEITQITASNSSQLNMHKVDSASGNIPSGTLFDFLPVDSTFMQYKNDRCGGEFTDGLCYGHVSVHQDVSVSESDSNLVLSVLYPGKADGNPIYLDTESRSDDSSQLLQFFSYDQSSQVLKFIGVPSNLTTDAEYGWKGPYGAMGFGDENQRAKQAEAEAEERGVARVINVDDAAGDFVLRLLAQK